ncbi:MAG: acyl carrier protein [Candidatus Babeliales bacterium]
MFDKQDTTQKVTAIIASVLNTQESTIKPSASLETLGADSLDRLEIIMKLEETFGIDISDDDEAAIKTVQEAVNTVHSKRTK